MTTTIDTNRVEWVDTLQWHRMRDINSWNMVYWCKYRDFYMVVQLSIHIIVMQAHLSTMQYYSWHDRIAPISYYTITEYINMCILNTVAVFDCNCSFFWMDLFKINSGIEIWNDLMWTSCNRTSIYCWCYKFASQLLYDSPSDGARVVFVTTGTLPAQTQLIQQPCIHIVVSYIEWLSK